MAIAIGLGNGAAFKLVPEYFAATVGSVTGLVGAAGGLGVFSPPLALCVLKKSTGSFTLGFVFLGIFAAVCLLALRPKLFAVCLVPPESGSPQRTCSRQPYCTALTQPVAKLQELSSPDTETCRIALPSVSLSTALPQSSNSPKHQTVLVHPFVVQRKYSGLADWLWRSKRQQLKAVIRDTSKSQ
jgi:hypothetical protein